MEGDPHVAMWISFRLVNGAAPRRLRDRAYSKLTIDLILDRQ